MNPDSVALLSSAYVVVAVTTSAMAAIRLNRQLQSSQPKPRPYRWGYFVGCTGLACGPGALLSAFALVAAVRRQEFELVGTLLVFTTVLAVQTVAGGFIIARKRWAWVIGTLFSFNLLLWVINGIYAGRRWSEFTGQAHGTGGSQDEGYELLAEATDLEVQGRAGEALLAYQRLADTHGDTPAGKDALLSFENLRQRQAARSGEAPTRAA
jgi:hypothetical protein